jgi:hypothetical protein
MSYEVLATRKPDYATEGAYKGIEKNNKISQLKTSLIGQQNTINKGSSHTESIVCAKCVVAKIIAKEFLKRS